MSTHSPLASLVCLLFGHQYWYSPMLLSSYFVLLLLLDAVVSFFPFPTLVTFLTHPLPIYIRTLSLHLCTYISQLYIFSTYIYIMTRHYIFRGMQTFIHVFHSSHTSSNMVSGLGFWLFPRLNVHALTSAPELTLHWIPPCLYPSSWAIIHVPLADMYVFRSLVFIFFPYYRDSPLIHHFLFLKFIDIIDSPLLMRGWILKIVECLFATTIWIFT